MDNRYKVFSREEIMQIAYNVNNLGNEPIIIEVTGTPNAGKSPAINTITRLLKKYGFNAKVIKESASSCKISEKFSVHYDLWTACDTIKQLIECIDMKYSVIISERGIFDAICWADLYRRADMITRKQFDSLLAYYSFDYWLNKVKLVYLMSCEPEESIRRDDTERIMDLSGSIVNNSVLKKINESLLSVSSDYKHLFPCQIHADTTSQSQNYINQKFVSDILGFLFDTFSPVISDT